MVLKILKKKVYIYICLKIVRAFIQPPSFRGRLAICKGLAWPGSHRPVDTDDVTPWRRSDTKRNRISEGSCWGNTRSRVLETNSGNQLEKSEKLPRGDWKGSRRHLYLKGMKYQRGRGMSRYRCEPAQAGHGDESRIPFPKCQIRFQGRQA